jgi:hypothetical protein
MDYGEEDEFAEEDGNADLGNEWFLRIVVRGVVIRTRISIVGYLLWRILLSFSYYSRYLLLIMTSFHSILNPIRFW